MPKFLRVVGAGVVSDSFGFNLQADDNKVYECIFTAEALGHVLAAAFEKAKSLPPASGKGTSTALDAEIDFAVLDAEPGIALHSGPLLLTIQLGDTKIAALKDDIDAYERQMKKTQ